MPVTSPILSKEASILSEAVLKVASAVTLIGPVCVVAKDILDDVRKCADKADDVLEAGRRVCDTLKTIEIMACHLGRLESRSVQISRS